jgi:hypothetical protein
VGRSRKKKTTDVVAILVLVLALGLSAGCKNTDNVTPRGENPEAQDLSTVFKGPAKSIFVTTLYGEGEPYYQEYQFDEKGKLVSKKEYSPFEEEGDGLNEALSEKDAQGRYTKEVWGTDDEIYNIQLTEYTADGHIARNQWLDGDGTVRTTTTYRYDGAGNQTMSHTENSYNNSTYTNVYEFDDQNRLVKSTSSYDGQVNDIQTYRYDVDGWDRVYETEWVNLGKKAVSYEKIGKDSLLIASRRYETDENGTRLTFCDTTFTDASGCRHQRNYYNYDKEYSYEGVYNKQGYLTHCELFTGKSTRPAKTLDLEMAPDGESLKSITFRTQQFGQVEEEKSNHLMEFDSFGNWTDRTLDMQYTPDLFWSDKLEDFEGLLTTQHRTFTYYGDDQGQNYGFEGKAGQAPVLLTCTEDHGVLFGEISIDGNKYRAVGRRDEEDAGLFFVALEKDGKIPWSLSIDDGEGKRSATLFKGNDEIAATLSPVRDGLKTYKFSTTPDEMVGIYEYDFADEIGSGRMDVSRGGENWEEINFDIFNVGRAPSRNMAKDSFSDAFGEDTVFYRYLWNEDNDAQFSYRIRFFDGFAVIVPDRGDPSDFFGFGTTIAGIYAKIPSVG